MKTLLVSAALAAAILVPSAAGAQAVPAAVVAVVDLERVSNDCNACKTASAALRSQATAQQNREKSLGTPLETEQKSIQTAIDALKGAEPDAALQARIKSFQTRGQAAQQEAANGRLQLQRNQQFIQKQITDKLGPIYQSVMARRGANVLLESGSTLAAANSVDVTSDILAALNTALPTISVTAPAAPKPATPQGR
jgi:outer membrane protein